MPKQTFDIDDLYKIYANGIISESKRELIVEKEEVIKLKPSKKTKKILYYDTDPNMVPATFMVDFNFNITFDIDSIKQNFGSQEVVSGDEYIDDDDIDKAIMQQMKQKRGDLAISKKKTTISLDDFYYDVFYKKLTSYGIKNRLNELIRAGVIHSGDFNILALTYSTQADDKLIFRKLLEASKKNTPKIKLGYGYQIAFEAKTKMKFYTKEEILIVLEKFSEGFEDLVLKDTPYYIISST